MLNAGSNAVGTVTSDKDVSRMSRGQASNVLFPANVLPSEFAYVDPNFNKTYSTTTLNGSNGSYLAGYEAINIPGVTDANTPLCGVSLHPMQKPHLVAFNDFNNNKNAIAGLSQAASDAVPPNAFKSGGMAEELKSAKILQTISCAVAGTVGTGGQFTASMPNGYMVIANGNSTGTLTPPTSAASESTPGPVTVDQYAAGLVDSAYGGGTQDIFSDVLMQKPVYVTPSGAMSEAVGTIQAIIKWKQDQVKAGLATTPVPSDLANAIDGPNPKQSSADNIDQEQGFSTCTNYNSAPGDANSDSNCVANLSTMADVYLSNVQGGTQGGSLAHLMAVEYEKAELINPRPGGGPASSKLADFSGGGVCTGMKAMPINGIPSSATIDFGVAPTVGNLLSSFQGYSGTSAVATTITNQFKQRLYQMKPTASSQDIADVMAYSVPMGSVKFVYVNSNNNFVVGDSGSVPAWINTKAVEPDGTTLTAKTLDGQGRAINLSGSFVDMDNEAGFEHPWDCEGSTSMINYAIWTRSSGYNGTLGVLRFTNCATDSGQEWQCPC